MGHFPLALKLHDVSWLHGVDIIVFRKRQLNFFCCTGSRKSYIGSIGWQNNNNSNPKFQGQHI